MFSDQDWVSDPSEADKPFDPVTIMKSIQRQPIMRDAREAPAIQDAVRMHRIMKHQEIMQTGAMQLSAA